MNCLFSAELTYNFAVKTRLYDTGKEKKLQKKTAG